MTGNPTGKVRRKRIFGAADEAAEPSIGAARIARYPTKFMNMEWEAGLFLKKAF